MVIEDAQLLVSEIQIGKLKIRNRFVRSATHEWLASEDGSPTSQIADIHDILTKNEIGLSTSGYAYISPDGKGAIRQQGMHSDHVIPFYRRIADRVHSNRSAFLVQLVHTGRFADQINANPMSPTELPVPNSKIRSRSMTQKEIKRVINDYVKAIARTKKSGADGAQLHCAHGFLLSSFFSPFLNRREDDWGTDTEGRTRIAVEIMRKARKKFPDFPLTVKMNCYDGVEGGIDLKEAVNISKILSSEGIDAIEVSGGIDEAPIDVTCQRVLSQDQEAYFKDYSKAIRKKVDCPVILVGGIRSLEVMREIISGGFADMIALSRPLIREPDIVSKILNGKKSEASCVSCNKCFDSTGVKCNRKSNK